MKEVVTNPLYNEELDNAIKELKLEIYKSLVIPILRWIKKRPYIIVIYGLILLGLLARDIYCRVIVGAI